MLQGLCLYIYTYTYHPPDLLVWNGHTLSHIAHVTFHLLDIFFLRFLMQWQQTLLYIIQVSTLFQLLCKTGKLGGLQS